MTRDEKSNDVLPTEDGKEYSDIVINYSGEKLQIPSYHKILVTDDGKEYTLKAINHAMAISNMSGAEIVLLRVIDDVTKIEDTSVKVQEEQRQQEQDKSKSSYTQTTSDEFNNEDITKESNMENTSISQTETFATTNNSSPSASDALDQSSKSSSIQKTIKGPIVDEMEETIKSCREAGCKNKISYIFKTGDKIEQIIGEINSKDYDMVILTSKNIDSWLKSLFSDTRKIIGNVDIPVLIAQ